MELRRVQYPSFDLVSNLKFDDVRCCDLHVKKLVKIFDTYQRDTFDGELLREFDPGAARRTLKVSKEAFVVKMGELSKEMKKCRKKMKMPGRISARHFHFSGGFTDDESVTSFE